MPPATAQARRFTRRLAQRLAARSVEDAGSVAAVYDAAVAGLENAKLQAHLARNRDHTVANLVKEVRSMREKRGEGEEFAPAPKKRAGTARPAAPGPAPVLRDSDVRAAGPGTVSSSHLASLAFCPGAVLRVLDADGEDLDAAARACSLALSVPAGVDTVISCARHLGSALARQVDAPEANVSADSASHAWRAISLVLGRALRLASAPAEEGTSDSATPVDLRLFGDALPAVGGSAAWASMQPSAAASKAQFALFACTHLLAEWVSLLARPAAASACTRATAGGDDAAAATSCAAQLASRLYAIGLASRDARWLPWYALVAMQPLADSASLRSSTGAAVATAVELVRRLAATDSPLPHPRTMGHEFGSCVFGARLGFDALQTVAKKLEKAERRGKVPPLFAQAVSRSLGAPGLRALRRRLADRLQFLRVPERVHYWVVESTGTEALSDFLRSGSSARGTRELINEAPREAVQQLHEAMMTMSGPGVPGREAPTAGGSPAGEGGEEGIAMPLFFVDKGTASKRRGGASEAKEEGEADGEEEEEGEEAEERPQRRQRGPGDEEEDKARSSLAVAIQRTSRLRNKRRSLVDEDEEEDDDEESDGEREEEEEEEEEGNEEAGNDGKGKEVDRRAVEASSDDDDDDDEEDDDDDDEEEDDEDDKTEEKGANAGAEATTAMPATRRTRSMSQTSATSASSTSRWPTRRAATAARKRLSLTRGGTRPLSPYAEEDEEVEGQEDQHNDDDGEEEEEEQEEEQEKEQEKENAGDAAYESRSDEDSDVLTELPPASAAQRRRRRTTPARRGKAQQRITQAVSESEGTADTEEGEGEAVAEDATPRRSSRRRARSTSQTSAASESSVSRRPSRRAAEAAKTRISLTGAGTRSSDWAEDVEESAPVSTPARRARKFPARATTAPRARKMRSDSTASASSTRRSRG